MVITRKRSARNHPLAGVYYTSWVLYLNTQATNLFLQVKFNSLQDKLTPQSWAASPLINRTSLLSGLNFMSFHISPSLLGIGMNQSKEQNLLCPTATTRRPARQLRRHWITHCLHAFWAHSHQVAVAAQTINLNWTNQTTLKLGDQPNCSLQANKCLGCNWVCAHPY